MLGPNIISRLRDERAGITYEVLAYRHLTAEEISAAFRQYFASQKGRRKKIKRGQTIRIDTIIGYDQ